MHSNFLKITVFLSLFYTFQIYSQEFVVKGIAIDSLNIPLQNATIIAKSLSNTKEIQFTSSNEKGLFQFQLKSESEYAISISYIGFQPVEKIVTAKTNAAVLVFEMLPSNEQLIGIELNYKAEAIIIKQDTVVFNVSSFTDGNERKLKDQIKKMPGMEVDKNGVVTYQGKKVKTTMVEGASFFGGGSKIAVENIPADAVEKIELLDNFSEVNFMKTVSETDQLIMNIKLKKDKKEFLFGDIEAAHALNNYYKYHANLFYYSPKTNYSFIGDANNNGSNALDFQDIMRIEKNIFSSYSKNKNTSSATLYQFAYANDRVLKTNSKFGALNYTDKLSEKTTLESYLIYSKNKRNKNSESTINYFNNNFSFIENRKTLEAQDIDLLLFNMKLNFRVNENANLKYSLSYKNIDQKNASELTTFSNGLGNSFLNGNYSKTNSINQFFEYNNKKSLKHFSTFVVNHQFTEEEGDKSWLSNQIFLQNSFPFQNDSQFEIDKVVSIKNNNIDATYSKYFIFNAKHQITTSLIGNLQFQTINEVDKQILSNGNEIQFNDAIFGNQFTNRDSEIAVEVAYKLSSNKWRHFFNLNTGAVNRKTENKTVKNTISRLVFKPSYKLEYKFSEAHKLNVMYRFSNELPSSDLFANGKVIQSFNTVFTGNSQLDFNESHSIVFDYSKRNIFKKYYFDMQGNYNQVTNSTANALFLNNIEQITSPIQIHFPSKNLMYKGSFTKTLAIVSTTFKAKIDWREYKQFTNNSFAYVNQSSQTLGIEFKNNKTNWPLLTICYENGRNQFKSTTNSKFQNHSIYSNLEIELHKNVVFTCDYEYNLNQGNGNKNVFQLANAKLEYQKESKPFLIGLSASNLFNVKTVNSNFISDYTATYNTVYVLPRIVLLSVSYKL